MKHGIYKSDGPVEHLRGFGALLRDDPNDSEAYLAQFDPYHLMESHCWRSLPKSDFVLDRGCEGDEE